MKTLNLMVLAAVLCAGLSAGDKKFDGPREGPIQKIIDHATELNLTTDQVAKLEALKKSVGETLGGDMREKLKEHPEARELMKEMKEARDSGDEAKIKAAREKMRDLMAKNGGEGKGPAAEGKGGDFRGKLAEILTPPQLEKVKEYMKEARDKMKDGGPRGGLSGKDDKGQKPDTTKEAPKVFE